MRPCAGALSPADDAHHEHDLEPIATHTHWPFIGYAQLLCTNLAHGCTAITTWHRGTKYSALSISIPGLLPALRIMVDEQIRPRLLPV